MSVLILDNVSCEIDDRFLFRQLSARINAGDFVQLLGPNGAGKTTLLKIISGLFRYYEGQLRWGDHKIPSYEFYTSLLYLGHQVGIKASLTALENMRWYFGQNGLKSDNNVVLPERDQVVSALAEVGLAGYEDVPAYQMSAGQQRRIALARLWLSHAPLWVLDEPFTAIDKQGVKNLEARMMTHCEHGGMVLMTSHQNFQRITPRYLDLAKYAGELA